MSQADVIAKIKKLRALATSDNEHEAAAAAAAAERLLQEHRLSEAELEGDSGPKEQAELSEDPLDVFGRKAQVWKGVLVFGLGKLHGCYVFQDRVRRRGATEIHLVYRIVGRPSDVATVRYLYAWLTSEIERLAHQHGKGKGRTWFNSYRRGAVAGVLEAMRGASKAVRAEASATALVRLDERMTETESAARELGLRVGGARTASVRVDHDAFDRGQRDGRSIHTGANLPNGAGPRMLGGGYG